jgi:hypothetical protein
MFVQAPLLAKLSIAFWSCLLILSVTAANLRPFYIIQNIIVSESIFANKVAQIRYPYTYSSLMHLLENVFKIINYLFLRYKYMLLNLNCTT